MKWPRGTSAKRTARGKGSATFVPMRASTFQPSSPEELGAFLGRKDCDYELKVDGVRVLADRRDGAASLTFRSGLPAAFPEVVEALEGHAHEGTVYDGEVVAFDEAGRPSFASLAPRLHRRSASSATHVVGEAVVYLVFDVLVLRGQTVANLPLSERRTLLEACAFSGPNVRVHPALTDGLALLSFAKTHGLEGIVRKERNSPYVFGPKAHPAWQKLKLEQEDDFVIVGYVTKGTRFVSLEVASFEGKELVLRARVGGGISNEQARFLVQTLAALRIPRGEAKGNLPPLTREEVAHAVAPSRVVSVKFMAFTPDGHLRMPVYRGLRVDVLPEECTSAPTK